ncbi:MAG: acyl carrier protein [Verrucomicrobia bacterium]|nr:acyl carrier protein [Verrucomicrobiota bacterium]
MKRSDILQLLQEILKRQGKPSDVAETAELSAIGFRSLDFSELALRVETASGRPLTFDAAPLRAIRTVADVLDFLQTASGQP